MFRAFGRRRQSRGQAVVEFALVLPVMLVLLLLAVDFGRLFFSYIAVHNAAREATSYAAVRAADTPWDQTAYDAGVTSAAGREANVQGQGGAGSLSVSNPTCFDPQTSATMDCHAASNFAGGIGNQVTVSVTQPFTFLTPLIGQLFGGQVNLSASATAPIMNPRDVQILEASPTPSPSPSPTPAPTPTPSPTPTPPPGATPTPAPTPTPTPTCVVPDYKNTFWQNVGGITAPEVWQNQGFTGTLTNLAGDKKIKSQTLQKNTTVPCTSDMSVDDQ